MPLPTESDRLVSAEPLSRQDFLRRGWRQLLGQVAENLPTWPEKLPDLLTFDAPKPVLHALRPPGAIAEAAFVTTCTPECTACRDACPRGSLISDGAGQPFLLPESAPCVMCVDVPCTKVCPTDALTPLATPGAIAMGTAIIELTVCTAFRGSGCHDCYTACPLPDVAIRLVENLPQILPDACTGCGVCVFACPELSALHIQPALR